MAMDYNILKKLTVDGVSMGVDTDVGTMLQSYKTGVNLAANVWNTSAQIQIPETGLYAILCHTDFGTAATTGATQHIVGWGNATSTKPNHELGITDATNGTKKQAFTWVEKLNKDFVIANFSLCNKACNNCNVLLRVIRLLSYSE